MLQVDTVSKMLINGHMIFARSYKRVKKRMSSAVRFEGCGGQLQFGIVKQFVVYGEEALAVISPLPVSEDQLDDECSCPGLETYSVANIIHHIFRVDVENAMLAIPIDKIIEKVVFMNFSCTTGNRCYVSLLLNNAECD